MKSFIIILSLLISTEIQYTLGAKLENKSATINVNESAQNLDAGESETLAEIGLEDSDDKASGFVDEDESQMSPDILASENEEDGLMTWDEVRENEEETAKAVDEIRKIAIAIGNNVMTNAKVPLEKVKTNFETLIKNAGKERDAALKKINEQYKKESAKASMIDGKATRKFAKAKKLAKKEYQQTKVAAEESYKKAAKEANVALNAAEKEFGRVQAQIHKNQQKVEDEHQPELEKKRKEKEAENQALKKLKQVQDKTEAILDRLSDTREKILKEARMKRDKAINQAKSDSLKSEEECDQILGKAAKQLKCTSQEIWAKWEKIKTQAKEDLKKAIAEVVKAQNDARNENKSMIWTNARGGGGGGSWTRGGDGYGSMGGYGGGGTKDW